MPRTATQPRPSKATPLAAAQTDEAAARAEVEAVTGKIKELIRGGVGSFDEAELADLEAAREAALKRLRHADLAVIEAQSEAFAVLTPKAVTKIRAQRRRAYDSHSALMVRSDEFRRLRERESSLESQIAAATNTDDFKRAQKDLKSEFVYGRDGQEHLEAPRNRKTPPSVEALARLERDLARTVVEVGPAQLAKTEAQSRWENAKATLDNWESAIRDLGPAARRALADIPEPGADGDSLAGWSDISAGPYQTPVSLHQSGKTHGRQ